LPKKKHFGIVNLLLLLKILNLLILWLIGFRH